MKDRAIFVMAYSRPNYLYVTLDSIRKCRNVSDWDLWVSFDEGPEAGDHRMCMKTGGFHAVLNGHNLNNHNHPTEILRVSRNMGYSKILFCEDDELFSPSLLDWVKEQENNWTGTISTLYPADKANEGIGHHSASPALLMAEHADSLIKFMDTRGYAGRPNVLTGTPINDNMTYDVCWWDWYQVTQTRCRYAPRQLCFNFGFNGMNYKNPRFDNLAFNGPPSTWLSNVIGLSKTPEFGNTSRTPGFEYV